MIDNNTHDVEKGQSKYNRGSMTKVTDRKLFKEIYFNTGAKKEENK